MPPAKRQAKTEKNGSTKKRAKKPAKESSESESDFEADTHGLTSANGDGGAIVEESGDDVVYPTTEGYVGRLVVSGATNWDLVGRKELPKTVKNAPLPGSGQNLWGPHKTKYNVKLAVSSCTACHSVIVTDDGRVMTWGRNDRGQLGLGDTERRDEPTEVPVLKAYDIVGAAVGRGHTLFLTSKGQVFACGDNKMGQLGIGTQAQTVLIPTKLNYKGKAIVKVACGAEFSLMIDYSGGLYSFGFPQYGQLGHNSEAKYFASGNKLAYKCEYSPKKVVFFVEKTRDGHILPVENVKVKDIACGVNHSCAVDEKNRCFSWGFGGYGRLGHSETKDELMPRLIKLFDGTTRGVKRVWCGSAFSVAWDTHNLLYFWGQAKTSGEATMYPKNVQDLNGWVVRSVGCSNRSIVVAADESVVSWGPSPTYGELAYGENRSKSSTTPQEVKPLDGIHIHHVSTGFGHSLFIARTDSEQEQKLVEALPDWP